MPSTAPQPAFARGASAALAVAAVAAGVAHAIALRWTADDAYLSFRYAEQWVHGHGLVFNPGERVEGYTNFLWTAWCALGMRLGLPPEPRRYAPHVTLARLKPQGLSLPHLQEFLGRHALYRAPPFPVERFSLVASFQTKSGAIYEDQADYPLG